MGPARARPVQSLGGQQRLADRTLLARIASNRRIIASRSVASGAAGDAKRALEAIHEGKDGNELVAASRSHPRRTTSHRRHLAVGVGVILAKIVPKERPLRIL